MERPANIPEDIYVLITESAQKVGAGELRNTLQEYGYIFEQDTETPTLESLVEGVLENPAPYLYYQLNILSRPDLLENLFIEFNDDEVDDGLTYLIDKRAADAIENKSEIINLQIVYGGGDASIPFTRIEKAFKEGCALDYSESKRK